MGRLIINYFLCLSLLVPAGLGVRLSPYVHEKSAGNVENEEDVAFLLNGVSEVYIGGSPGFLSIYGPNAFPVLGGQAGSAGVYHAIAAGSILGEGKLLGVSHDGFLNPETEANSGRNTFLLNSINWVSKRGPGSGRRVALIRNEEDAALVDFLKINFLPTTRISLDELSSVEQLQEFDVVLVKEFFGKEKAPILRGYAQSGGGLFIALTSWAYYFFMEVEGHFGENFPGNMVSGGTGFVWRGDELLASPTTAEGAYNASTVYIQNTNVLDAWKEIKVAINNGLPEDPATNLLQYSSILEYGFGAIPPKDPFWDREFYVDALNYTQVGGQPTPSQPEPIKDNKDKFLLQIFHGLASFVLKAEDVPAHPGGQVFPGAVASSKTDVGVLPHHQLSLKFKSPSWFSTMSKQEARSFVPHSINHCHEDDPARAFGPHEEEDLEMSNKLPLWYSTGLYAAAGEVVEITLNSEDDLDSFSAQIGSHTDDVSKLVSWYRSPRISLRRGFVDNKVRLSSPYGGLVYVLIPEKEISEQERLISVTVRGSVRAPVFRLGETEKHEWRDEIRHRRGPWAEFVTNNIVLTVPSASIRTMDDPEDLLLFWDQVMDAIADLISMPRERFRQERMVPDVQISAGFMHSGYPIMTFLNEGNMAVNVSLLRTAGSWGHFHELGHNHQNGDWTFGGTGEVTCNLFALYVYNTVCGIPTSESRAEMSPEKYRVAVADYIVSGLDFNRWKSQPFLALMFYVQLQREFGWTAYKQVFATYRDLAEAERPKNDQQKIDMWLVMFSTAVKQNLSPFFQSWGFPISDEASSSVSNFPVTGITIFDLLHD